MPESSHAPRSDAEKINAFLPKRGAQGPCPAPSIFSTLGAGATLETIGGALLIIGLFTWPGAFLMSGLMAFAHFIADAPRSFWPISDGGDSAIFFCCLFLYLIFAGSGPRSLAARMR